MIRELYKNWSNYHYITDIKAKNTVELYAGAYNGIYKTTDNGQTWIDISTNIDWTTHGYAYDLAFTNDGTIYAATIKGILTTKDEGKNWSFISTPGSPTQIEIDKSGIIYTNSFNILYESKDAGNTWQKILEVNGNHGGVYCILVNSKGTIFRVVMRVYTVPRIPVNSFD